MARFNRTMSASSSRPMRVPSLPFATVVTLSTMRRQGVRSPFCSLGATETRNNGAWVGSVVNAQTVMEFVASKRSSCTITTGRGLPA